MCHVRCAAWMQLEEVVNVHKKHVQALEKALRCLDNDAISSEELDPLKDDLEYYLVGAAGRRLFYFRLAGSGRNDCVVFCISLDSAASSWTH